MVNVSIDECGRGPLWGPVYAGAVIWDENKEIESPIKINSWDSKKLSEKKRNILSEYIKNNALDYAIGIASSKEIDELGIYPATIKAFHQALDNLKVPFDNIYVDGNRFEPYCNKDDFITHQCFIKGDDSHITIGMASIIAKVERDNYISNYCKLYPDLDTKYNLSKNKGYGTKKHIDGLKLYGDSEFHRKSFKWNKNL